MRSPHTFPSRLAMSALAACLLAACSAPQPQDAEHADSVQANAEPISVDPAEVPPPLPEDVRASGSEAPQGKRAAGQEGEPLLAYRAVGTEPFWGVQVDGDTLHFTTIDDQAGKHLTGTHTLREDGIRYAGSDGGTAFELDISRGACSDGMSDAVYAFTARFRYGATDYSGCAEQAMAK